MIIAIYYAYSNWEGKHETQKERKTVKHPLSDVFRISF